jgi:electron transport complex protein RnfB
MPPIVSLILVIALLLLVAYTLIKASKTVAPIADNTDISEAINSLLPQTQCGQCGYAGCRPYAEAMADGDAINKCPPGGKDTITSLANLLNKERIALDPIHGIETTRKIAFIIEEDCIGCTKCIQACPVDAILGASKRMHTVIESECTGCDLCVEPCPVDCIEMRPLPQTITQWQWPQPGTPTKVIWPQPSTRIGISPRGAGS